ncbi:MAG TPA: hypothetical protein PKX40_16190 [Spirochaetota bacterium]|nr:hypothetical protein [Spirochaetota bacterium]
MSANRTARVLSTILIILLTGVISSAAAQKKEKKTESPAPTEGKGGDAVDAVSDGAGGKDAGMKSGKKEKPAEEKGAGETAGNDEDTLDDDTRGARFKFKGQVKNLFSFHETDNFIEYNPFETTHRNLAADLTRVRLSPEFNYKDMVNIRVDYDNELIASNYGNSLYFKGYWRPSQYNDFLHLAWEPYRGSEVYYRTKVHRAYVKVSVDYFTATVGRQQIRFGSGKLWNPLDILNPVSPTFVEGVDDQKGTDAVKLDFFPDDKTEISLVYDMKKSSNKIEHFNMQDCNYILRAKTSIKDTDIAILGGYVSRRGVGGFDFAAILFDGMLRGSVIVNQAAGPYYKKNEDLRYWWRYILTGKDQPFPVYFQANVGYEYNFKAGVYFLAEYFYNQRALNYNKDLKLAYTASQLNAMDQKTYLQIANQFLTTNQHYLAVALGYDFHPLVRGEFFTIGDIQGRGIFWSPALKINAYENLDFTVGVMGAFVFNNRASDFSEFRKHYLYYASGSYVF